MRPVNTLLLAASALALSTGAFAQAPGDVTSGDAGSVPPLSQQAGGENGQTANGSTEPARAPGSKADSGTALPRANDNAGTTTSYTETAPEKPVEWPCAQRKVSTISAGTIWSGPDLAQGKEWEDDNEVASLAQRLASRRVPLDEANSMIVDFAKSAGAEKDKKLTELFVGVLDIINGNRNELLQGITRYAQGQERLAERMRAESDKISEALSDVQGPTGVAATEANRDFGWDQRIFKERRQALSYVCDTPTILEHRAYEIGKRIQAQL